MSDTGIIVDDSIWSDIVEDWRDSVRRGIEMVFTIEKMWKIYADVEVPRKQGTLDSLIGEGYTPHPRIADAREWARSDFIGDLRMMLLFSRMELLPDERLKVLVDAQRLKQLYKERTEKAQKAHVARINEFCSRERVLE